MIETLLPISKQYYHRPSYNVNFVISFPRILSPFISYSPNHIKCHTQCVLPSTQLRWLVNSTNSICEQSSLNGFSFNFYRFQHILFFQFRCISPSKMKIPFAVWKKRMCISYNWNSSNLNIRILFNDNKIKISVSMLKVE